MIDLHKNSRNSVIKEHTEDWISWEDLVSELV